jgi:hypothetical protein
MGWRSIRFSWRRQSCAATAVRRDTLSSRALWLRSVPALSRDLLFVPTDGVMGDFSTTRAASCAERSGRNDMGAPEREKGPCVISTEVSER